MGQTTFYQKNYTGWPPVSHEDRNNPESLYWEELAKGFTARLKEAMGEEAYEAWWSAMPDDGDHTWKAIYETARAKLEETKYPLECGCVLPEQSCQACRPAPWNGDELPFGGE
jgi:hypothetical protein